MKIKENKISLNLRMYTTLGAIYCCPFEILHMMGLVSYGIAFHSTINSHNVFHVSLLKMYGHDLNHVINWDLVKVK